MPYESDDAKTMMLIINSFYSVPLATLQTVAIPSQTIPDDAFARHVLPFLNTKMVGLYGVVAEDIDELRKHYGVSVSVAAKQSKFYSGEDLEPEQDEKTYLQIAKVDGGDDEEDGYGTLV